MGSLVIVGLAALLWYGVGLPAPFQAEVRNAIGALAPWAPLLVALYFVKGGVEDVLRGAWNAASAVVKAVGAAIFGIFFLIFIAPIMVADTFLLGGIAHWMWKYQVGPIALVVLSAVALGVILWSEGTLTYQFSKKYLTAAIIVGVVSIAWGYVSQQWTNTHRILFRIKDGKMFSDPAAGLRVKGGDIIKFSAFGRVLSGGLSYPPQGDLENLVGGRPRGEMFFIVRPESGSAKDFWLVGIEAGVTDFAGGALDTGYYTGGYYATGEARVPDGFVGKLGVGFNGLAPQEGSLRLTLQLNPHQSLVGRMLALKGYLGILAMLGLGIAIFGGVGVVNKLLIPTDMKLARFGVFAAGVVLFLATLAAARDATGIDPWRELGRIGPGGIGSGRSHRTPARTLPTVKIAGEERVVLRGPGNWVNVAQMFPGCVNYRLVSPAGETVRVRFSDGGIKKVGEQFGTRDPEAVEGPKGVALRILKFGSSC